MTYKPYSFVFIRPVFRGYLRKNWDSIIVGAQKQQDHGGLYTVIAVNNKKMRNPLDILMNKITLENGLKKTVVNKTDIYWIEDAW